MVSTFNTEERGGDEIHEVDQEEREGREDTQGNKGEYDETRRAKKKTRVEFNLVLIKGLIACEINNNMKTVGKI